MLLKSVEEGKNKRKEKKQAGKGERRRKEKGKVMRRKEGITEKMSKEDKKK